MHADYRVEGVVTSVVTRKGRLGPRQVIDVKVERQVGKSRDGDEVDFPPRTVRARACVRLRELGARIDVGDRVVLISAPNEGTRAATIIYLSKVQRVAGVPCP